MITACDCANGICWCGDKILSETEAVEFLLQQRQQEWGVDSDQAIQILRGFDSDGGSFELRGRDMYLASLNRPPR